jgi:hypothetical protein
LGNGTLYEAVGEAQTLTLGFIESYPVITEGTPTNTIGTELTLPVTSDTAGKIYYKLYAEATAVPSLEVLVDQGAVDNSVLASMKGIVTIAANATGNIALTGLTAATAYKLHYVFIGTNGSVSAVKTHELLAVSSIVVENIDPNLSLYATGDSVDGFEVTVPLNSTGFKRYFVTTTAAVRSTTYSHFVDNSLAGAAQVPYLVKLPGTQNTYLESAILTPSSAPLTSFGIWQQGGGPDNDRLTFESPRVITVYNRIIFDGTVADAANKFRVIALTITVPGEVLNNVATLGKVGTTVTSGTAGTATAAIVGGKVIITPLEVGTSLITVSSASGTNATFTVTVAQPVANGPKELTIGAITKGS